MFLVPPAKIFSSGGGEEGQDVILTAVHMSASGPGLGGASGGGRSYTTVLM